MQPGQPFDGVAGLGERHQRLGVQPFADVAGGVGDDAALGARHMRQRRGGDRVLLDRARRSAPSSSRPPAGTSPPTSPRTASPRRRRRAPRWRRRTPRPGWAAEFSIIDSSIWVATMTGLAFSLAIWMARFWTSGTSSSGSSTPEVAARDHDAVECQHDRLEVVDGLRLLELGDDGHPPARPGPSPRARARCRPVSARTTARPGRRRAAWRTRGRRCPSRTVPGPSTFMPGSDMPLLLLTGPPSVTVHTTSLPSMCSTTRPILPSSTSTRSPGVASSASRL